MLTPEDQDSPFAVRSAFRIAYSEVLRKVGDKLRADRESRPDEDDTDGEDDDC